MSGLFRLWRPFRLRKIQKQYKTEIHATLVIILTYYLLEVISAQTTPVDNILENSTTLIVTRFKCEEKYFSSFTWNIIDMDSTTHAEELVNVINVKSKEECLNATSSNMTHNSITLPKRLSFPDFDCILPLKWYNISLEGLNINNSYGMPDFITQYCDCGSNAFKLLKFDVNGHNQSRIFYTDDPDRQNVIDKITIVDNTGYEQTATNCPPRSDEYIIDATFPNLTLYKAYNISLYYYDKIKYHCRYETNLSTRLEMEDLNQSSFNLNYTLLLLFLALVALIVIYIVFKISRVHHGVFYKLKNCVFPDEEIPESVIYRISSPKRSFHQESNALYRPIPTTITDPYEFPRDKIELKVEIGHGAFGKVFYAKATGLYNPHGYTIVAVKVLRDNAPSDEEQDFLTEIEMLKKVTKHKNVIRMFACVTRSQPYMMIMELIISGNLKDYLHELREIWTKRAFPNQFFRDNSDGNYIEPEESYKEIKQVNGSYYVIRRKAAPVSKLPATDEVPVFNDSDKSPLPEEMVHLAKPVLDNKELENFALQIASGMAHLEKLGITHRDLAARNVLVTKTKTLKISDFGMSRFGTYVYRTTKRVPLRWMAIETLEKYAADSKSDVWSFGVVLWEIGTLGAIPYGRLENNRVLSYLQMGGRLLRPKICTDELYSIMLTCWATDPKDRPSFKDLVGTLTKKSSVYVEFSQINSAYVFPETASEDD